MSTKFSGEFGGLPALPGVRVAFYSSLNSVTCPLCNNSHVALLSGDIVFAAKMACGDLDSNEQKLAAFVCSRSHLFFLLEKDIVPSKQTDHAA
ncbi:MAG TPA: hypothetical protein VGG46_15700 [Terriglobales bacterium]|jgi:hypothetical protein